MPEQPNAAEDITYALRSLIHAFGRQSMYPDPVKKITLGIRAANQLVWAYKIAPIYPTADAFNAAQIEFLGVRIEATDD